MQETHAQINQMKAQYRNQISELEQTLANQVYYNRGLRKLSKPRRFKVMDQYQYHEMQRFMVGLETPVVTSQISR